MFIAVLFTIPTIWKQPKCPSVDEWIKMLWYIYTMEYYPAIKNKKFLLFVTVWIKLETIMLCEKNPVSERQTLYDLTHKVESNEQNKLKSKIESGT